MLKISASNFGPIIEGTVELKPLTVFVGPNNSGKSYMAMLIYSLLNQFPQQFMRVRGGRRFPWRSTRLDEVFEQHVEFKSEVVEWAKSLSNKPEKHLQIAYEDLPNLLKSQIEVATGEYINRYVRFSKARIERYFGARITELRRNCERKRPFQVTINQTNPLLDLNLRSRADRLVNSGSNYVIPKTATISTRETAYLRALLDAPDEFTDSRRDFALQDRLAILLGEFVEVTFEQIDRTVHYLPAARSGILQGHKLLASMFMEWASRVGVETLEFTALPGVVSDFVKALLIIDPDRSTGPIRRSKPLSEVAHHLETAVLHGRIDLQSSDLPYPEIHYRSSAGDLPLVRTSSMVSEMAPIVLWLKHVVNTGDLLILEEPESHLHPASQRRLAEALAMLVRRGVQVLITTHSDYLLSQLSNLTRLGALDEKKRKAFGYFDGVYLKDKEIGAYWFDHNPDVGGTRVKELPITVEDGIPEDAFTEVVENLYDESVRLQHLTSH